MLRERWSKTGLKQGMAQRTQNIFFPFLYIFSGGTLDVTVHQIQENGAIKEVYKASGGPFGGQKDNNQFKALLESIFTKAFIENYTNQNPIAWFYLNE